LANLPENGSAKVKVVRSVSSNGRQVADGRVWVDPAVADDWGRKRRAASVKKKRWMTIVARAWECTHWLWTASYDDRGCQANP
jgi:hypothetical protein